MAPTHFNNRSNSQPSREPYLPKDVTRGLDYTLVLDLDETLVHFDPVSSFLFIIFIVENENIQTKTILFEVPT